VSGTVLTHHPLDVEGYGLDELAFETTELAHHIVKEMAAWLTDVHPSPSVRQAANIRDSCCPLRYTGETYQAVTLMSKKNVFVGLLGMDRDGCLCHSATLGFCLIVLNTNSILISDILDWLLHHAEAVAIEGKSFYMKGKLEP
jgi:hypothetical protein